MAELLPPFADLNTPSTLSLVFSINAYMTDGFDGAIARLIRPIMSEEGNPFFNCVHLLPPSVDFHTPLRLPCAATAANSVPLALG